MAKRRFDELDAEAERQGIAYSRLKSNRPKFTAGKRLTQNRRMTAAGERTIQTRIERRHV